MQVFQPTNREYVPSVDLTTLGNTFNTLEQGHKDAVTAASSLKAAYAQLDLNPEEAAWRDAQIAQIQTTLDDNTNFGNAYGALDDIIAKQGDMMSDKELLTKLQANKDYKAYLDKIDKANLPETYKEYYRRNNKYNGQDQYDEKGNFKENYQWTPQETFVDNIDRNALFAKAVDRAAHKAGGTKVINDNGQFLIEKDGKWDVLSIDAIEESINAMIANTPGMSESLAQDYKILKDRYSRGELTEKEMKEITDNSGNFVNEDTWKKNIIHDYADAYDFNHQYWNTEYKQYPVGMIKTNNGAGIDQGILNEAKRQALLAVHSQGTSDYKVNVYDNTIRNQQAAGHSFSQLIQRKGAIIGKDGVDITPENLIAYVKKNNPNVNIPGPVSALNEYFKMTNPKTGKIFGEMYNDGEKLLLESAARNWGAQQYNINQLEAKLDTKEKDAFNFGKSLVNGYYNAENSTYDKKIINGLNKIFDGIGDKKRYFSSENLNIDLNTDTYNNILKLYNGHLPDGILMSNDNGKITLKINNNYRNIIPKFLSELYDNEHRDLFGNSFICYVNAPKDKQIEWKNPNYYNGNFKIDDFILHNIVDTYNNGIKNSEKVNSKFEIISEGRISQESTMYPTQTAAMNDYLVRSGYLDATDADRLDKRAYDNVTRALASDAIATGFLMDIKDYNDNEHLNFTKPKNQFQIKALINHMALNHPKDIVHEYGMFKENKPEFGINGGIDGYYITFTVPDDYKGEGYKKGDTVKFFLGGTMLENTGYNLASSAGMKADAATNVIKFSNNDYNIIPYNNYFGSTAIKNNRNGSYSINFMGQTFTTTDIEDVNKFANALYSIEEGKGIYQMTGNVQGAANAVTSAANYLSAMTGLPVQYISSNIFNFMENE